MVDLVKIRKKAKEKAAAEEAEVRAGSASESAPNEPPAAGTAPPPAKPESQAPAPPPLMEPPLAPKAPEKKGASPVVEDTPPAVEKTPPPKKTPEPKAPPEPKGWAKPPAAPAPAAEAMADETEAEPTDRLERFKRLAGKRRTTWMEGARAVAEGEVDAKRELELLRFRLAGEDYAVDIDKIVEIVPPRATTRVPNAHDTIVGIMSLRGTIVTVLDLRRKLGHPPADIRDAKDVRMIVVERAGETAGFLVDRVSRVVKLDPSQLESHPVVSSAEQSEFVSGVFQATDGLVILLDLERILAG